jgi:glutathione S-transferase
MFGAKAEIAAMEKGVRCDRVFVPFSIATLYEPKSDVVLRVNPKAQVPVLIHGDLEIYDSTQIFEYLEDIAPNPPLWPGAPRDRARARLLELESDEVFFPEVAYSMPARRKAAGEAVYAESITRIHRYFAAMDAHLADREFLMAGFGYADIAFYGAQFFARFLGQPPPVELVNLDRWRRTMNRRESVESVMGSMAAYLSANGIEASI